MFHSVNYQIGCQQIMLKQLALGACLGIATASSFAQTDIKADPNTSAYLQDSRGVIVRGGQGLCWRTGQWSPSDAVAGCDGALVPPVAKPTAPAVVPAPGPVVSAPAPELRRCDFTVTLSNDQAFAFNKTTLNPTAGKIIDEEVLPQLAKCGKVDSILITGHADRLGSQQYNQKLSEKRADAVATYLRSRGVATEIATRGAGSSQPITECKSNLRRTQIIACLAPNRRVVIEVSGIAK